MLINRVFILESRTTINLFLYFWWDGQANGREEKGCFVIGSYIMKRREVVLEL